MDAEKGNIRILNVKKDGDKSYFNVNGNDVPLLSIWHTGDYWFGKHKNKVVPLTKYNRSWEKLYGAKLKEEIDKHGIKNNLY